MFTGLQKSKKRLLPSAVSFMRAVLPTVFSMFWPLIAIWFFSKELWGLCVDGWLYFQLTAIFIAWGNRQYLLKKFDLLPLKINETFSESFFSRSMLFIVFILFSIFSPFEWQFRLAAVLYTLGRFITNSYEPYIEYKRRYSAAITAEVLGFVKGAALVYSLRGSITPNSFLLCIAIGEMVKAILTLLLVREVKIRFSKSYFNLNYFIQSFPYFIYGFTILMLCLVDRMYVYTKFSPEDKAFYQIFMNILIFILAVPGFLLVPFFRNYYRGKVRLNSSIRLNIFIGGFAVLPLLLLGCYVMVRFVYGFPLSMDYMGLAVLFCAPAFISSPITYYLLGKNQHFIVSTAYFAITAFLLLICPYLVNEYGMQGAMFTAVVGQWSFMIVSLFLYFQEKNARKIKLIK